MTAEDLCCGKCGSTVYEYNRFNHICSVNAFGRCETLTVGKTPVTGQELVRIQLKATKSWVVTVTASEITAGAVVQVKLIYGGGNVNSEVTYDVGDRVDIPVVGNSVRAIGIISGTNGAQAQVCASVSEADWGNAPNPNFYMQGPFVNGDPPNTFQAASGPARLLAVTAYQIGGAADGFLMFFDKNSPAAGGDIPRWSVPILSQAHSLATGIFVNVNFALNPIAFTQGVVWAISSTGDVYTAVGGASARVDLWFANKPLAVVTTNIPDTTGPHIP